MKGASLFVLFVMLWSPIVAVANPHICHTRTSYPTYYQQHKDVIVEKVLVRREIVERVPDFFYSSRDYLRDEAILESIKALREANRGKVPSQNKKPVTEEEEEVAVSEEVDTFLRGSVIPEFNGKVSKDVDVQMVQLVKNSCLSCHNKKIGHIDLSDLNKLSFDDILAVNTHVVEDGTMPPKGKLPDAQLKVVKNWVRGALKASNNKVGVK